MILFRNITFDLKYERSSDEDEKEDGTSILTEAPLTETYKSMRASQPICQCAILYGMI